MPSTKPLPTVSQLLEAGAVEIQSKQSAANVRRGSSYDLHVGTGAILWAREAERDRKLFEKNYLLTSDGDWLEWRIQKQGGPPRIQGTKGKGRASLTRSSLAGGTGKLLAGTRIFVSLPGHEKPMQYSIALDTEAEGLSVAVPIKAVQPGPGSAIVASQTNARVWLEDIASDDWTVESLQCQDGTVQESDDAYRARYWAERKAHRVGSRQAIYDACLKAGAVHIALFDSSAFVGQSGNGINRCFVAFSGLQYDEALLVRCRLAVDKARAKGCVLTVGGMVATPAVFDLTIALQGSLVDYNTDELLQNVRSAVLEYFEARNSPYLFALDGVLAEIARAVPEASAVVVNSAPSDTATSGVLQLATLPVYSVQPTDISVTFEAAP